MEQVYQNFYIKPQERGLLFHRSHLKAVLLPGTHQRWGWHWNLQTYDLNQPRASIPNLELLLQTQGDLLGPHLNVVYTAFNEVALVQAGQQWQVVLPNQLQAFWQGFIPVAAHRFNLEASPQLPAEFVAQAYGTNLPGLKWVQVGEAQMGLVYEDGNFTGSLEPGRYGFWTVQRGITVQLCDRTQPQPRFPQPEVLLEQHRDFLEAHCLVVEPGAQTVAVVRYRHRAIAIVPPGDRAIFWQGVTVEAIDLTQGAKLPDALMQELVGGSEEVLTLCLDHLHMVEVPAQHVGLLYGEGAFLMSLPPGWHGWWRFGRSFKSEVVDLRLQTLEVAGQEILSRDKVPLRLNLTAGFRITNPSQAKAQLADIPGFLYKELQFALRGAVGTRSLDELLEDKGAIDRSIAEYMLAKTTDYGLEIESVGVKDIILPGDMKAILCQVVEAEKAAQANVIRRREETAATRSMLNTARVMENNPVALRLKELEVLERIADKIDRITVHGGLDNVLTDLIRLEGEAPDPRQG